MLQNRMDRDRQYTCIVLYKGPDHLTYMRGGFSTIFLQHSGKYIFFYRFSFLQKHRPLLKAIWSFPYFLSCLIHPKTGQTLHFLFCLLCGYPHKLETNPPPAAELKYCERRVHQLPNLQKII